MKIILILLFSLSMFSNTLKPIEYVNIKQFSGLWYEIARTYNSFQHSCVASSVEYILEENNEYDIKNRCFEEEIGGKLIQYNGTGKSVFENDNMSRINMTYFWIFTKEYRVIYMNSDYSSAIVVDEALDAVWIMHRKPFMQKEELNKLVAFLSKYIDTKRLIYTPQDAQGRYK